MSEPQHLIECVEHGQQPSTCVCQHIAQTVSDGEARGFCWADDPDNPRPDAWCSKCEAKVQETGGVWNDESETFAGVMLLCSSCYDRAKAINIAATLMPEIAE